MNPEENCEEATSPRKNALTTYNTTMPKQAVVSKRKQKKGRKKKKRHVLVVPEFTGTLVTGRITSGRR